MPDLIPEFGTTWHYSRTDSGFSVRLGHRHGTHRFTQIAFIRGTGEKQERLALAITALPELARSLLDFHEGEYLHNPGARPDDCGICAVLNRVMEVQP